MRKIRIIATTVVVMAAASSSAAFAQETRSGAASGSVNDVVAQVVDEPAGSSASVLLTRQGQRLDLLETDLRDMRGILETDVRNLKMQITQLGNNASSGETATTAEIRDLRDQIERLADAVAMTSRRMERTLELTSDMEFRLLRMEKRLQTLMNLGGDELARAAVQDDTIPAGDGGQVAMSRDVDTGEVVWQMSESELNKQLVGNENEAPGGAQSTDLASLAAQPADSTVDAASQTAAGNDDNASVTAGPAAVAPAPPAPKVLPDADPEEQYNFALGRAMQNDLETAEAAFAEFREFNKGHPREADALFWLGRIQFLREQFDLAAMTFSEFNSAYPDDARIVDTTMWIAEAVSRFAPADQACAIYASLPNLIDSPPERFTERLAALSQAANCGG
jgi:TolA-binding protein